MRLGELEGIVGEEDGYTAESDAAILLQGLDIPDEMHERKMSELQGGQKVRVLLAQALFGHPEALLLDEPTNHLDLDSIHWLREFLVRYDGTLIVISHDRHFLNSVCTHVADIDYQTIISYTGGYDDMNATRQVTTTNTISVEPTHRRTLRCSIHTTAGSNAIASTTAIRTRAMTVRSSYSAHSANSVTRTLTIVESGRWTERRSESSNSSARREASALTLMSGCKSVTSCQFPV